MVQIGKEKPCGAVLATNGQTTSLKNHVKHKHAELFKDVQREQLHDSAGPGPGPQLPQAQMADAKGYNSMQSTWSTAHVSHAHRV